MMMMLQQRSQPKNFREVKCLILGEQQYEYFVWGTQYSYCLSKHKMTRYLKIRWAWLPGPLLAMPMTCYFIFVIRYCI